MVPLRQQPAPGTWHMQCCSVLTPAHKTPIRPPRRWTRGPRPTTCCSGPGRPSAKTIWRPPKSWSLRPKRWVFPTGRSISATRPRRSERNWNADVSSRSRTLLHKGDSRLRSASGAKSRQRPRAIRSRAVWSRAGSQPPARARSRLRACLRSSGSAAALRRPPVSNFTTPARRPRRARARAPVKLSSCCMPLVARWP